MLSIKKITSTYALQWREGGEEKTFTYVLFWQLAYSEKISMMRSFSRSVFFFLIIQNKEKEIWKKKKKNKKQKKKWD